MTVLEARDVGVTLGGWRIIAGVSLRVKTGSLVGLIGPNGAGKTTLLRALAALQAFTGHVGIDGISVTEMSRRLRARTVAYMAQGQTAHWPLSVRRLVALGRLPHLSPWARPSDEDDAAIERAMQRADVAAFADRNIATLSGGERARAMLARALAVEAPVLLVDEPIVSLDPYHQLQVMELLRGYADAGSAVVVVLHDLTLGVRFCHSLALMDQGLLVAEGSARTVLDEERLHRVYRVTAHRGTYQGEAYLVPWQRLDL